MHVASQGLNVCPLQFRFVKLAYTGMSGQVKFNSYTFDRLALQGPFVLLTNGPSKHSRCRYKLTKKERK